MSFDLYEKAKKMGSKSYKASVSKGRYPYLPVLDDIIEKDNIVNDVSLGLVDIPLDRVVGTSTAGRTQAFAANFMPLMEMNTEFASKWSSLADAHLSEGIRDAIKVYEYLNYYYVVEGNKRVSVLKYFRADSIPAFVTRKIPKLTDDPEIKIYYEFMDFNRKTGVNFIWFTHEGSYKRLIDAVSSAPKHGGTLGDEPVISDVSAGGDSLDGTGAAKRQDYSIIWSDDTLLELKAAYRRFEKSFKKKGGENLVNITTGDAFLAFIELESFDVVCDMGIDEMQSSISSMWQEFQVINEQYTVNVSLDPPEEKKNVISQLLTPKPTSSKPLKVAFIFDRDPVQSDWLYGHELGRNHIKEVFGDKITTLKITTAATEEDAINAIEELIENEKVEVIFTTTTRLVDASLKCAIKYPDVKILNCSLNTSHRYIRTYDARLYEAKFLSGMVAGSLTETNRICYLADYPIFGVTANINAFALGAKMVNPYAKVVLKWSTLKENSDTDEIYRSLYKENIDFVSDQDLITPNKASRRFGLYRINDSEITNMTIATYNWGIMYEKLINMILTGGWDSDSLEKESKPINYWWGFTAGVVDIILSERVPVGTRRLVDIMRGLIIDDRLHTFDGEIYSQSGELVGKNGLDIEDIIKMDWLAENVEGSIPEIQELAENAQEIVEMKGVKKGTEE